MGERRRRNRARPAAPGAAQVRERPRASLLLDPGAEGAFVNARGLLLGKLFEGRIDHGFHRPLAQDLRAEGMDGADGGFFQMLERVLDVGALAAVLAAVSRARSSSWRRRSFSSPAALLVNVTATMWSMVVSAAREHGDDARDQLGGFAGAGRRFHEQALAERSADALARGAIVELRLSSVGRHGRLRMSISGSRRSGCLRLDALLFVRAADGAVIADGAGAGLRSGRQKAFFDESADGFEHARQALARLRVERNADGGEIAALRAEEEAAGFHRLLQQLFGGQRVEQRLEDGAAADVLRTVLRRLAGLVIGDAQSVARGVLLHQIDRAAQADAIQDDGFVLGAVRIAMLVGRRGRSEFEVQREPIGWSRGHLLDPAAQIGAEVFDFALPDARDGGREIVFELGRDAIQHLVGEIQRCRQAVGRDGKQTGFFQLAKQLELHGVEERAARERIHLFQRRGRLARAELKDGLQQEAVGAGREMLQ